MKRDLFIEGVLANQVIRKAMCIPGATVHWYNKPEIRKQRKMGHITIVGPSMGVLESRLQSMLQEDCPDSQFSSTPCVGIIMRSDSDLPVMKEAAKILKMFDVNHEVRIISAHRTPELMFSYASSARETGTIRKNYVHVCLLQVFDAGGNPRTGTIEKLCTCLFAAGIDCLDIVLNVMKKYFANVQSTCYIYLYYSSSKYYLLEIRLRQQF